MWKLIITMYFLSLSCTSSSSSHKNYFQDVISYKNIQTPENGYEFEVMDLLGLAERPMRLKRQPSLRNSASKFLLQVYNEFKQENEVTDMDKKRLKRMLDEDSLISESDRQKIDTCNNIISFLSKESKYNSRNSNNIRRDILISFNTNNVPHDLQLVYSALRIYQDPLIGRHQYGDNANITISVYQRVYNRKHHTSEFKIHSSINSTTGYRGWLEVNVTRLLSKWINLKTLHNSINGNDLSISVTLSRRTVDGFSNVEVDSSIVGLVQPNSKVEDLKPFIVGYFNGPELMAKIQSLRFKRDVIKRKRKADFYKQQVPHIAEIYKHPKTCERLNFTLDFKDLHMHNWVIAPKKFEAYFCGGECNFPLGSKMNATNHAIVQTLMHLKQPNLPKPCCVPTVLGSISILHYLNEDSVNLSKYPQSVAKECGCH